MSIKLVIDTIPMTLIAFRMASDLPRNDSHLLWSAGRVLGRQIPQGCLDRGVSHLPEYWLLLTHRTPSDKQRQKH